MGEKTVAATMTAANESVTANRLLLHVRATVADHIASNYLLWTKETLRKAIINAGYTGSGVRNKVLPTKEVLQNLYRTHVLAAVAAAPPPPVLPPPTYTPRSCNVAEDSHHETDESESERDNTIEHFVVENSSSDDSASLTTKRARYDENTLK
jgi:hypothetical protein